MTRNTRTLCSLLAALAIALPAAAQPGTLKLPPYKKVVLRNGMTLLLMEQHEVPLVSFSALLKAGSVADPAGNHDWALHAWVDLDECDAAGELLVHTTDLSRQD